MRKSWKLMLALLAIFGMIAAACGGDDDDSSSGSSSDSSSSSSSSSSSDDGGAAEEASSGDLATCPDPLVIQTDWFPESEHGAMYELFGSGAYSIDAENLIVSGTLHDGATDTGIGLEVRTGGPAIGFSPVASYMYTDSGITLGYANTEAQVTFFESAPLLSVVAPLEKNPQMVMWDPATYPDVNSLKDLGDAGITISVFGGGVFAEVFIAQGIWSADQVDPSYDGSPANFIANGGTIAQQGFASAEPYDYENVFTDWGKPVKLQLLHDAGFPVYSQTIAIRSAEKDALDECLKALVPVIQRATVSFVTNPDTANGIIIDAVETFGSFWVYSEGLADFSVNAQKQLGLVGNGPNDTVGDMEEARIQSIIDIMDNAGIDTGGITTADIYTNEYIDPSIGFSGDDLCVDQIGVNVGLVYDIGGRGDQSFNDSAYAGIAG
ncbi:MAG: nitrate ABC transporter substrate-binding protein [Actinomycetota bacterium]|nr:MAG: nitrate ABC transporter substrate-binding protein [Actinomycetota bacterium]